MPCCALAAGGEVGDIGSAGVNDNTKLNKYGFLINGKQVEAIICQVMVIVSMAYYGWNRLLVCVVIGNDWLNVLCTIRVHVIALHV